MGIIEEFEAVEGSDEELVSTRDLYRSGREGAHTEYILERKLTETEEEERKGRRKEREKGTPRSSSEL